MILGIFHPIRIIVVAIVMTSGANLIEDFTTRQLFFFFIGVILGGILYDLILFGVKWLTQRARRSHTT